LNPITHTHSQLITTVSTATALCPQLRQLYNDTIFSYAVVGFILKVKHLCMFTKHL